MTISASNPPTAITHVTALKPATTSTVQVMGGVGRGNLGMARSVPTPALQGNGTLKTGGAGKMHLYCYNSVVISLKVLSQAHNPLSPHIELKKERGKFISC